MNKTILLALFAGLLGGMLTRYISPIPVFAQAQVQAPAQPAPQSAPPVREVRAQSFALVDPSNRIMGIFSAERDRTKGSTRIILRDADGQEVWSAPAQTRIIQ